MKRLCLFIFCSTQLLLINADVDPKLLCSPGFCQDLISDEACTPTSSYCEIQNSTHSGINMPSLMFCNCCPYCLQNILKDEYCTQGSLGSPPSNTICGPGLYCNTTVDKDDLTCVRMNSPCHDQQDKYDNDRESGDLGFLEQRAICDDEGKYGPVVCIPGQTCFCQNRDAERIFGEAINEKSVSQNMQCACSLNYDTTEKLLGIYNMGGPRCLPDGSYDKMQCIGHRCFCVFQDTGLLSSSIIIDSIAQSLTLLPCYDREIHHSPSEYLKPCEKERAEMLQILMKYKSEGFDYLGSPLPACQADGNYHKIQINGTKQICVSPDGEQIDSFEANIGSQDASKMKCNCARTLHLLRNDHGVHSLPACDAFGNWQKTQRRRNYWYCVDPENGIQIGLEKDSEIKCP